MDEEVILPGAFGTDPQTVPVRINFQGEPIGTATVAPDGRVKMTITDPDTIRLIRGE